MQLSLIILLIVLTSGHLVKCEKLNDLVRKREDLTELSLINNQISNQKCEEITVPMCRNMQYNMTSMPNQFNHETQQEAAMEAHQFWALVEINCAKELRFFLCSMYTPICMPNYPQRIQACKSVCLRARLGCEKYMKKFGFEWPEHMNCDLFPEYGSSKDVCMDPMDAEEQKQTKLTINHSLISKSDQNDQSNQKTINNKQSNNKKTAPTSTLNKIKNQKPALKTNQDDSLKDSNPNTKLNDIFTNDLQQRLNQLTDPFLDTLCQRPFIKITDPINDIRFDKLSTGNVLNCIQPCHSVYFNSWEQTFSYYWLLIWSIFCLLSSLCTTFTYLIESGRFKYPEKPIIYLSICYLFVSLGYMLRFLVGHEQMACESDGSIKYPTSSNSSFLSTSTTTTTSSSSQFTNTSISSLTCTLTFVLIYYFGMASSVWWVIISLTWFLAAGLKWGTEAIAKYSTYFHLFAWLLPFVKTIIILVLSLVDADPLTGVCYVGNLSSQNLRLFVMSPAIIYLTIGITFLIAGFVSLFRIRNMIKRQHGDLNKAQKLEKLMLRIGIFSILYTVPATFVIACQFYEQHYRADWERNKICSRARQVISTNVFNSDEILTSSIDKYCGTIKSDTTTTTNRDDYFSELPEFSIFILKYLMSLIVGVTSGFWIWTKKTLNSWNLFFSKLFCCCHNLDENSSSSNKNDTNNSSNNNKKLDDENNNSIIEPGYSKFSCLSYCLSLAKYRRRTRRTRKDSIVYFQANDDLENNPHNFCETPTTPIVEQPINNMPSHQSQQMLTSNNINIYQNHLQNQLLHHHPSHQMQSQLTGGITFHQQKPESVVSLQFNSATNTVSTQSYYQSQQPSNNFNPSNGLISQSQLNQQQPSIYQTQFQASNNCHTNKAAAFFYDYSSSTGSTSRNERATLSSKCSIPSTSSRK